MADEVVRKSIRNMPRDLWQRVRLLAVKLDVTTSNIVVAALMCYLEKEE